VLGQVLRRVAPAAVSPDLLAGFEHFDDAGAVRLGPGRVGLYTVDFFPPVVDDPRGYGAIAAANSLSDVYACGGEPKVVLNLAGIPEDWDDEILGPLFDGAVAKVMESGALWVGGHSVRATEPMFGFAVFGEVAERERIGHDRAQAGDRLFLTKPIGAGSITTGIKKGKTAEGDARDAMDLMARLNRVSARAARAAGAKCATDVTGFGLLGHAANLAQASQVEFRIEAGSVPLYAGAEALARKGIFSGGSARGKAALGARVEVAAGVPDWLSAIGFDAETSGGLLVCVPAAGVAAFRAAFPPGEEPAEIGEVRGGAPCVRLI
jgi:selenide,water dikinase